MPNTGKVVWNADGVLETGAEYQARFNAQTSGWCRPAHVTLNGENRYLSAFVHNEIGPWVARHGMTADGYQAEFDSWTPKGYFPICVQGGGSGASTRYAALFVKQEMPLPQQFNATGVSANADIDNVIRLAMKNSPVWNASLAIVHGKKLVYARGYAWGEPDWPVCQPTSRFRIASVSKTVTALAAYQLIGEGKLKLTDKVQDILQLKTPSGGAPKDSRFKNVTVRHLLEHTSGINANAFRNEVAILRRAQGGRPQRQLAPAGHRRDVRRLHRFARHGCEGSRRRPWPTTIAATTCLAGWSPRSGARRARSTPSRTTCSTPCTSTASGARPA